MWSFWTGFLPTAIAGGVLVLVGSLVLLMAFICAAGSIMLWNDDRLAEKEKRIKRLKAKEKQHE